MLAEVHHEPRTKLFVVQTGIIKDDLNGVSQLCQQPFICEPGALRERWQEQASSQQPPPCD